MNPWKTLEMSSDFVKIRPPHSSLNYVAANRCLNRFEGSARDAAGFDVSHLEEAGGGRSSISHEDKNANRGQQGKLENMRKVSQQDLQPSAKCLAWVTIASLWPLAGIAGTTLGPHPTSIAYLLYQQLISHGTTPSRSVFGWFFGFLFAD
jgi:hypothetical protein